MKRNHDLDKSYKGKHFVVPGLQFRGLSHCHHGRKHGIMQVDMVLEKELECSTSRCVDIRKRQNHLACLRFEDLKASPLIHFSNRAIPTPCHTSQSVQIMLFLMSLWGIIFTQTPTTGNNTECYIRS